MAKYLSVFFAAALLVAGLTSCSGSGGGRSQSIPQVVSPQSVAMGSVESLLDRPGPIPFSEAEQIIRSNPKLVGRVMKHPFTGPGRDFYTPTRLADGSYVNKDGERFVFPEKSNITTAQNVDTVAPLGTPTCINETTWSGNTPPNCDKSGPFRRVFSLPNGDALNTFITFPSTAMVQKMNSGILDDGYIYVEAWTGPNTQNYEFGFQYSPLPANSSGRYNMYISRKNINDKSLGAQRFHAGDQIIFSLTALENEPYIPDCTSNTCAQVAATDITGTCEYNVPPPGGSSCGGYDQINAPGWVTNCCVFARMTTIAQKAPQNFNDGSEFGSVTWSGSTEGPDPNGIIPPWTTGGTQSWPADDTVNLVLYTDLADEIDTIYLHP